MTKKRMFAFFLLIFVLGAGIFLFLHFAPKSGTDSTGYTPDLSMEYLVTQYSDATGQQGTFYTISNDETLIIIDGGWADNEAAVRKVIAQHGNKVDAWIISHPHRDHAGAFNAIYADPGEIIIEEIFDNGFDYDFIESVGEPYDDITVMETYYALTKDAANVTHLKRGDVLDICGLTFSVYNAYDDIVLNTVGGEKDYQNNASLLFKVSSANSSMLFARISNMTWMITCLWLTVRTLHAIMSRLDITETGPSQMRFMTQQGRLCSFWTRPPRLQITRIILPAH